MGHTLSTLSHHSPLSVLQVLVLLLEWLQVWLQLQPCLLMLVVGERQCATLALLRQS